jgi:methionine aminotransferase
MPIALTSKLPEVKTTIFTVMSQLAAKHGAINLSQGFPDFDAPEELVERVTHHMHAGHNQYAPLAGPPLLRERIAEKTALMYGAQLDSDTDITVAAGATEALFAAIHAVVRPGDEVILFDPAYDSYVPAVELAGGLPRHLKLRAPDYRIDWNEVESRLSDKTRLIIINSPHNPTGTTLAASDLDALAELVRDRNVFILSDEVYEHIVYDGAEHQSVLRHAELRERGFVVSSFGKTYHVTGWKVGYCVAPPALSTEFRKVHQYLTFCANAPVQFAFADFLENQDHYLNLPGFYQAKRDYFLDCIQESRFQFRPCAGTYFQLLDYSAMTDKGDVDYARELTESIGVASIPVSIFYADGTDEKVLRFCFAKDENTLARAAEILCAI